MNGSSGLLRSRIGRVPLSHANQIEHVLGSSHRLVELFWLLAFALGWVAAIALVAQSGVRAWAGLFLITVLAVAHIGSLLKEQQHLRAEASAVARILEKIQPAASGREAVQSALTELMVMFDARAVLLLAYDRSHERFHFWTADRAATPPVTYTEFQHAEAQPYMFPMPAQGSYVVQSGRSEPATLTIPDRFRAAHRFRSMIAVSNALGEQWTDRLFVLDTRAGARPLRLLRAIARQTAPAIHSLDLLEQLRSQVGAAERARVARELHDGIIQSLIGLEMQVEVWRRTVGANDVDAGAKLGQIQEILRREILDVRDLIQQMKPPAIRAHEILEYLADLVERFQRQTGILAHFVSEVDELTLSPRVCGELARIVQEALVNVRKHSGARNVLVRVSAPSGYWKFEIDDDGRGFGFAGRFSHADLEIGRKGPVVIKERVRAIGATLALESAPGQGARIEVWLPRDIHG